MPRYLTNEIGNIVREVKAFKRQFVKDVEDEYNTHVEENLTEARDAIKGCIDLCDWTEGRRARTAEDFMLHYGPFISRIITS